MPGLMSGLYMGGTECIGLNDIHNTPSDNGDPSLNGFEESDADEDAPYENPQTGQRLRKRLHSPSDGGSKKRSKIPGGRPAINKLITEDLDSDDQRIMELKRQGYSDPVICDKLVKEGRTRYKPDTVNSRALRIRRMMEKLEDEKLDDELSDWHIGEDELLEDSVNAMQIQFEHELQKLIDKKWKNVSDYLNPKLPGGKRKYTAAACKERWEALQSNKALLPIELDSDQEGRKNLRESRITRNKTLRKEAKAEIQRIKDAEQEIRDEKKRLKHEKEQEREQAKLAREAEKAETQRIAAEKRAGKLRKMEERRQAREAWRADIDEKRRIRELEERIYRKIMGGKQLNRVRRLQGNDDDDDDCNSVQDSSDDVILHDADEEDAGEEAHFDVNEGVSDRDEDNAAMPDLVSDREEDQFPDGTSDSEEDEQSDIQVIPSPPKFKVTTETLRNPRSIMTDAELSELLLVRKLPRRGANESHPEVVARLAAADNSLKSSELTDLLKRYFDGKKGSKEAMAFRLQTKDAENSAAGKAGITSTDEQFIKSYKGYSA